MEVKFLPIPLTLLFIIFSSCSVTENDCICTAEWVMITAAVLDQNNKPLEGLETVIRNRKGKVFDFRNDDAFFPGNYIVMTDEYTEDFSTVPEEIIFTVIMNNKEEEAVYLINTDRCSCHVNKVSGPDTLVLR